MRVRKNTNGSVPRLANGGAQKWADGVECCCDGCTTCCWQVTFSGVTVNASGTDIDPGDPFTVTTEGTLNASFIICGTSSAGTEIYQAIPVAFRIDYGPDDPQTNECGYLVVAINDNGDDTLRIRIQSPTPTEDPFDPDDFIIFEANIAIPAEVLAMSPGDACSTVAGFTASGSNELTDNEFGPCAGTGSVTIEYVDACDFDPFTGDCSTPETFGQTICDEDECPCGRTSEQPTCLLVTLKGSDGTDSVYQNGTLVSGTATRDYVFSGPYRRDDGTWWRFVVVTDDPDVPAWDSDGAYFEHQCPGDNLDSYSGAYTLADDADWAGSVATVLAAHQTALANIGTTVTVAACTCEGGPDVFNVSIQCDVGTTPDGWTDIEVTRTESDVCTYEGDDGTYEVTLNYNSGTGEWTCEIRRIADGLLIVDAIPWSAGGDDPTGTHGFNGTDTGFPDAGDDFLDEQCSALSIIIS